jgi:hypothetical protein
LDGLRGCAVLMVTIWHSQMLINPSSSPVHYLIWRFSIFGQSGVDLFFVLSGFLIIGILYDNQESQSYSLETVKRIESMEGELRIRLDTLTKIKTALEKAGIDFIAENGGGAGVRLRKAKS